jgi:ABC transporter substrate binding protein (PQQ-dependent alcohol dehydrogenase system)
MKPHRLSLVVLALALIGLHGPAARAQRPGVVTVGYVELKQDARYPALPFARSEMAATLAIEQARDDQVGDRDFVLAFFTAATEESLIEQVVAAVDRHGLRFFVLDLPAPAIVHLSAALRGRPALLFNATTPDDALRGEHCAANLVHTGPSRAMTADALAQYITAHHWHDVLLLEGAQPEDRDTADAFVRAAEKFGARIVARRALAPEADEATVTAAPPEYDVVYIADAGGASARRLPYRTTLARPVIGAAGLVATAWHARWDGAGAQRLSERFLRRTQRAMTGLDWSAWMAVDLIVQAVAHTRRDDLGALRADILGGADFDGAKDMAVSVRPWDHQLRQPILLTTSDTVVATAPTGDRGDPIAALDTLGDDRQATPCRLAGG